jgi:hypothetical protein
MLEIEEPIPEEKCVEQSIFNKKLGKCSRFVKVVGVNTYEARSRRAFRLFIRKKTAGSSIPQRE